MSGACFSGAVKECCTVSTYFVALAVLLPSSVSLPAYYSAIVHVSVQ